MQKRKGQEETDEAEANRTQTADRKIHETATAETEIMTIIMMIIFRRRHRK